MKIIFSIFLSLLILVQSSYLSMIYVYYHLDMDAIVENFCVNKEKPQLKCRGKCHLAKVTQESQDSDKKTPIKLDEKRVVIQFFEASSYFQLSSLLETKQAFAFHSNFYDSLHFHSVFRPPKV